MPVKFVEALSALAAQYRAALHMQDKIIERGGRSVNENELLNSIAKMLDEHTKNINERLDSQDTMLGNLGTRLDGIDTRLDNLEVRMDKLEVGIDKLEVRIGNLEVRMDKHEVRLDKLEGRLDKLEGRLDKVQVNQESVIMPRLDLLYEGHTALLEKMQHDPRFETLQDEVDTLKDAVKYHTTEINNLKKAQ